MTKAEIHYSNLSLKKKNQQSNALLMELVSMRNCVSEDLLEIAVLVEKIKNDFGMLRSY